VRCRLSPSGNRTAFRSTEPGSRSAAGAHAAIAAIAVSSVISANRRASAAVLLAASTAAITRTAGHAVALSAQAIPVVTAAPAGLREPSARDTHSSAITGTSVPPVVTCSEMTGEASAKAVSRSARRPPAPVMANARKNPADPATVSHSRGSPAQPGRPAAAGSPKTVISGS